MISSFLVVLKVKIKYILNTTMYNNERNKLFKSKAKKLESSNVFEIALQAFFINLAKSFLFMFAIILTFGIIPINYINILSIESSLIMTIFISIFMCIINPSLNDLKEDMLYEIEFLHMDYKKTIVSNHILKLCTSSIIFYLVLLSYAYLYNITYINTNDILMLSLVYMSIVNICFYINLKNIYAKISKYIVSVLFLITGYILLYFNLLLSEKYFICCCVVFCLLSVIAFIKIIKFNNYKKIYLYLHDKYKRKKVKLKNYENKRLINEMSTIEVEKDKNPYKNFINIFNKRYAKTLPKRFGISIVIMFALTIFLSFKMMSDSELSEYVFLNIYYAMPFFIIILCLMNSSKKICKNFYNRCDIYMFTHNFYKYKNIDKNLYIEKLKYIIKNNLLKTNFLSIGLMVLYYIGGLSENNIEYLIIILSINLISIMISTYYLTMYYLFNPFKQNLEKINPYNLVILYFPFYIGITLFTEVIDLYNFGLITVMVFVVLFIINYIVLKFKFKNN